jgi:hypothetical protein
MLKSTSAPFTPASLTPGPSVHVVNEGSHDVSLAARRAISIDCEMITMDTIPPSGVHKTVLVSLGVVDTEMESLLYARVAVPLEHTGWYCRFI